MHYQSLRAPFRPRPVYRRPYPVFIGQIARRYNFPDADGAGQHVVVVSYGGAFAPQSLRTYMAAAGLSMPRVTVLPVGGIRPPSGVDVDAETPADIEMVCSLVPRARVTLIVAPNTDAGSVLSFQAILRLRPRATVVTISWGSPEERLNRGLLGRMEALLGEITAQGTAVMACSDDFGRFSDPTLATVGVEYPASSPHTVACGGTDIVRGRERAWVLSGGGYSRLFPPLSVHRNPNLPTAGRGVPDVSGLAGENPGYLAYFNGKWERASGTSMVAPLYAGLFARIAQLTGQRLPHNLPEQLYTRGHGAFTVIGGPGNGLPRTEPGWSPSTGLGVVNGQALLRLLS